METLTTPQLIDIAISFIKNPTSCPMDGDAGSQLFPEETFGDLLSRLDSDPGKAWEASAQYKALASRKQ